jgi:hypothetical protein
MSRDAFIGDTLWQSFPDGTDDTVINNAVQKEVERRDARDKGAVKERQPAGLTSPHMTSWAGGPESAKREGAMLASGAATMGGGQLASRLLPQLPRVAPVLGEMLGSLTAKGAETGLEGRLPTAGEASVAMALPAVGRGVVQGIGKIGEGIGHILPGRQYAMQEQAVQRLRDVPNLVKGEPSKPIYNELDALQATKGASKIPMPQTKATAIGAQGELSDFLQTLRDNKLNTLADQLESLIVHTKTTIPTDPRLAASATLRPDRAVLPPGGPVQRTISDANIPLDVVQKNTSKVGQLTQAAGRTGTDRGTINKLFGSMKDDVQAAADAGDLQAQMLVRATAARKAEGVRERLGQIFEANVRNKGAFETVTGDTILNVLKKPKVAQRTLEMIPVPERAAIMKELQEIAKVPGLPNPNSSWSWANRALGGVAGASIGFPAGVSGAIVGGVAGAETLDLMRLIMKTPTGRRTVMRLLENQLGKGPLVGPASAAIGQRVTHKEK